MINIIKKTDSEKDDYYSRLHSLTHGSSENEAVKRIYQNIDSQSLYQNNRFYEIGESKVKLSSDVVLNSRIRESINDIVDEYKYQDKINNFGLKFDNKILFFGPSGCGKTLTALALANALKKRIYIVNLSTIVNSSLGKTSSNIFEIVEDAKANQAIIFFDEFDALSKIRNDENDHGEMKRVASSILQIMDFLDEKTVFIAATNHIDLIDKAIIRRFSRRIEFIMPDKRALRTYIDKLSKLSKIKISNKIISKITDNFVGLSFAEARDEFLMLLKKYLIKNIKGGKDSSMIKEDILKLIKKSK